jgi:hypothetical protein
MGGTMDTFIKLQDIALNMHLEPAEETNINPAPEVAPCGQVIPTAPGKGQRSTQAKQEALGISHAVMPGGKTIPLLKTLLTSACERNCFYCPFAPGVIFAAHTFQPEEMAKSFMDLYRAGIAKGCSSVRASSKAARRRRIS